MVSKRLTYRTNSDQCHMRQNRHTPFIPVFANPVPRERPAEKIRDPVVEFLLLVVSTLRLRAGSPQNCGALKGQISDVVNFTD